MTVPLIETTDSGGADSGQYHTMTDGGTPAGGETPAANVGTAIIYQTATGDQFVLGAADIIVLIALVNIAFTAYGALTD